MTTISLAAWRAAWKHNKKVNKHGCRMHAKLCWFYGSLNSYTDTHGQHRSFHITMYIWTLELLWYFNDLNMTPVFYFEECIHLCTNSSAGEGLGGTAGGSFLISTWGGTGVWFGDWSGTSAPTASLDVSWHFRSAPPRWTESEAVFVMGEGGVGSFCGEVEEGWEGGALVWGSGWELQWSGGSGMAMGVSLREDTFRSWVCVLEATLQLLLLLGTVSCWSCWMGSALLSE